MKLLILCLCFIVVSTAYAQDSTFSHTKDSISTVLIKKGADSLSLNKISDSTVISRDTTAPVLPKNSISLTVQKRIADTNTTLKDTVVNKGIQLTTGSLFLKKAIDSATKHKLPNTLVSTPKTVDSLPQNSVVDSIVPKDTIADIFTKRLPDSARQNHKKIMNANSESKRNAIPETKAEEQKEIDSLFAPKNSSADYTFHQLFKPYKKFEKNSTIETQTNLSILQQNVSYKTNADFNTEYFLKDTVGGQFRFDVSVTKLNTEVETMGVQLQYNSEQKQDSTSTFAKPLFDIVGKHAQLIVDSNGVILQTDTTEMGRKIRSVLGSLSLSSGGDAEVGDNFSLIMNKRLDSLKIGDVWKDSTINKSNKRVNNYKVQNILRNDIIILVTGSVEQTGSIQSDGHTFETKFTGLQTGKMKVDAGSGLIKSKNIVFTMKGSVEFEGKAIPASAVSKINEAVTTP
ncbi:DUF6263 family protein [Arachidicoccus sp.]|uniref:DUF6263 family protein n=1 Tax=Arachidicoccus sp. TaxID=1872624 RepID=UPI003D20F361